MNIDALKINSELVKISLDHEDITTKYGDAIEFWTHSHPKLTTYFQFFEARINADYDRLEAIMRELILNSEGNPTLDKDQTLPADIFTAAIVAVGDLLGKSISKTST